MDLRSILVLAMTDNHWIQEYQRFRLILQQIHDQLWDCLYTFAIERTYGHRLHAALPCVLLAARMRQLTLTNRVQVRAKHFVVALSIR